MLSGIWKKNKTHTHLHTHTKSFINRKISFMQLHHILRKLLGSRKLPLTRQSQISMFGHTLVSCLCLVNNTSVFSSFTSILLTGFSTSASRGRRAPLWEQPSSQPLGSWPTSESMFDKRATLSLSKRWGIKEALAW